MDIPFQGLQTRVYSLEHKPNEVKASNEQLRLIYEGSALGLKGPSLAYHAQMSMSQLRQLEQSDERVEQAVIGGRADSEREMAMAVRAAALNGDAKMALEVLKHQHGWVATTKQELTGENGGPVALAAVDFRGLSNEELQQMKGLLEKANE